MQDNVRIKELLADLENWKRKYDTDKSSWDSEAKRLNDLLAQKQREIDELKSRGGKDLDSLMAKYRDLESRYKDLEQKVS